uniref:TM0106 family RecB-like putative nuclease n=1 Tax=Trichocoleus desertorum TaxID=1481672 RepID=UPI0025B51973|nr:TM0106 family RecB-like putative nuclease [Trichocoleus desertorum]
MFLTTELLLQYQRCSRRAFLDIYGDLTQRDPPSDYLLKLIQDSTAHRRTVLTDYAWQQPVWPPRDWVAGGQATLDLMRQGVECIYQGILVTETPEGVTLVSQPDLLIKQPGQSYFGDWIYVATEIKLGKRPKLEYQIIATFHTYVLAAVQGAWPETSWLILREKGSYEVDLWTLLPQMQTILQDCMQTLLAPEAPEVFIARNRCNLCGWLSYCSGVAQAQQHLSLLPGVTASRYAQLQALNLVTVESLASSTPTKLETLPGFGPDVAHRLVWQAQSVLENRAIAYPDKSSSRQPLNLAQELPTAPVELYFDIEAEPDVNVAFLHGVLVVDRRIQQETFYPLLAERPEDEVLVWQQFIELVNDYPDAPIFHFCPYEAQTVERLAKLYDTPAHWVRPLLNRFVDLHERVTRTVILPVESYALKPIARWVGFDWRDAKANGAQAICWYSQWLETGDRTYLDAIVQYNEDDCRATYQIKDWLVGFLQEALCSELV